jgi:hypothetical protein
LSLGAGTLLAPMVKDRAGAPALVLDGEEVRILATLSLGFRKPIPIMALKFIKRASMQWARGEKTLAHFELAYARLPRFDTRDGAKSLFYADGFLRLGVSPRALMLARGLDTRQLDLLKYSPDQPRVPAGHGRQSGEWTSGDAAPTAAAHADVKEDIVVSPSTDAINDAIPFIQPIADTGPAANDWRSLPVNLAEEEAPNGPGHAISEHVAKTEAELSAEMRQNSYYSWLGDLVRKREGSFDSLENANDLVNRTLRAQADLVDRVTSGQVDSDFVQYRFGFVTGYEMYRSDPDSQEFMKRNTYGVGVLIWHDSHAPRGFRIRTAYPKNFD